MADNVELPSERNNETHEVGNNTPDRLQPLRQIAGTVRDIIGIGRVDPPALRRLSVFLGLTPAVTDVLQVNVNSAGREINLAATLIPGRPTNIVTLRLGGPNGVQLLYPPFGGSGGSGATAPSPDLYRPSPSTGDLPSSPVPLPPTDPSPFPIRPSP